MAKEKLFIFSHKEGNIKYYNINPKVDIYINAICLKTGKIEPKKITEYTYHYNLIMYKIHDPKNRFNDFWVSDNHSLITRINDQKIDKVTPLDIMAKPEKFELIKKLDSEPPMYIRCDEIEISFDPEKTEAADFTVEDYFTFSNSDGVFIQDTMAAYIPLTSESKNEAKEKLWSHNQLISPSDGEIIFTPNQDVILGLFQVTRDDLNFEEHTTLVEYKGEMITLGRKLFNETLPEDYPVINETIDKKALMRILSDISNMDYDKQYIADIYDKIKDLGFIYSTLYPISLSLEGFDLGYDYDFKSQNIFTDLTDKFGNYTREEKELEKVKESFPFKDMINSGARGNWNQVKQMVLSRGYLSDISGKITQYPIISSNYEGLTQQEYFLSCYGTRKGLIDTSENTSNSGYLTRTLVYAASGVELDFKTKDCGTKKYLEILIKDHSMLKSLEGRYHIVNDKLEKITKNDTDLIGKIILLRSPIHCRNKSGICKTCYGDFYKIVNSTYIGIVAAQSLGEVSTQLVLRTFHSSGSAILKEDSVEQADIISDIKKVKQIFGGSIDYTNIGQSITDLYEIYQPYKNIKLQHFEVIVSQLLWYQITRQKYIKLRFLKDSNYDPKNIKIVSIKQVPIYEHWLLGCLYGNLSQNLFRGLLEKKKIDNILTKLAVGDILNAEAE